MSDQNATILQYLESIERKIDDLSPRVHKVEKWQANADGKITMFGLFCTAIGSFGAWLFSNFKH